MNNELKEALEFYKLESNYILKDLKEKRNKYIKENVNITVNSYQELKESDTYYKILLKNILESEELFQEEVFDFERRLVFYTRPGGKFNDLSEKYLIKLQYVKSIEELDNLENNYYVDLQVVLGLNKKKKNSKDYLNKEKENFDKKLESDFLTAKIKDTREVVKRYKKDLERINNLKNMLKLEEKYKRETTNLEREKEDILLEKRKYELQNELKLLLNIPNNNMYHDLLGKYQELINKCESSKELESIHEEFLKEYGTIFNKNQKYTKELKKNIKKLLENKLKESNNLGIDVIELFRELSFKIEGLEENKLYEILPLIDKIDFNDLETVKNVIKECQSIIYIHKYNGDVVSVTRMDKEARFYSLMKHDYFEMPTERLKYNFISLKSFLRQAEYVGDREVNLVSDGKKVSIKFPCQEFIYYHDGIMMSFEHGYQEHDNFYFYPDSNFKLHRNPTWSYEEKSSKYGPAADIFKDKEYTYQMVLENLDKRIEREFQDNNSKKL